MKTVGFLACLLVAVNCVEKATGMEINALFAPNLLWVWWVPACFWTVAAILFVTGKRF